MIAAIIHQCPAFSLSIQCPSVPWCAMVTLEERLPPRLLTRVNFVVVDRRLTSSRFGRSLLRHWRAWLREVAEWGEVYCG
jgi:hypothetical protein